MGTLYGVSVGTGDPELITVKGQRILQETSVIAFPMGVKGKQGLAEKIIANQITPQQKKLPLCFPYLQDEQQLKQAWKAATEKVWEYLYQGINVAFACEGDVSLYSTFSYLARTLKENHPQAIIQTIPGVCSPMATASILGIPLTSGSQNLAIIPALYNIAQLDQVLSWAEVVVLLKVSSVYRQVWKKLKNLNLLDHAFIVERATQPGEKIYRNLTHHPNLNLSYFSLMIIHRKTD